MQQYIFTNETNRFSLGDIVLTQGAMASLKISEINGALKRHSKLDWGEVSPEEKACNDLAVVKGDTLHSVYTFGGKKIWVITAYDRSVTTVLLPSEY